jgi:hypothetical protein
MRGIDLLEILMGFVGGFPLLNPMYDHHFMALLNTSRYVYQPVL